MGNYYGFEEYVPVAKKRENARKYIEKLKKKNPNISPVVIEGRTIANTWWGKSWNQNLESYADLSNRIARGRSYVRNGAVLDLQIESGKVKALVQGSGTKPYQVNVGIDSPSTTKWKRVTDICNHKIETMEDLMLGKFPKELEILFTTTGDGLFPTPKEIHFECNCPDSARVCKHIAAVLYGVSARLDKDPLLFFKLRNIDVEALIKKSIEEKMKTMMKNAESKSKRALDDSDVFDLFGV